MLPTTLTVPNAEADFYGRTRTFITPPLGRRAWPTCGRCGSTLATRAKCRCRGESEVRAT
jgi:hypothetical protein